jgi:elongation factor P--(R)-beta-lysine ligase
MSPNTPWWRPDRFAVRRPYLETRARIVKATRAHFNALDFTEVETPALQVSPGLELHLVAFRTELKEPGAAQGRPLYLHTSPEFSMKKLLAAGMEKIFQLARVQRNAERSATHHPEFTMLEWYRANDGYETLMRDCESLLWTTAGAARVTTLKWQGRFCDPHLPAERVTVADAFMRHTGIDILATAPDPLQPSLELLEAAAQPTGIAPHDGDRWDDLFFRIFLERIEPKLGIEKPTILYDYPVSMAALSRPKESDPRLCERFELYVCGLELANAFGELTDAEVQRQRFTADMDLKQKLYNERYPIDEDFLEALAHGLPPTAGIALGFDRLVMLATGANRIEDVLWAPVATVEDLDAQGE